jgi:hypothetical protein
MDMDVDLLVEVALEAEEVRTRADVGQGGLGRLLHHIAELAGDLHPPGAGHERGFHQQQFAAQLGVGHPVVTPTCGASSFSP